ncbi:MAG: hypothetical protein ACFFC7_11170 [Candidatus Hermodarchaeota archaeon]
MSQIETIVNRVVENLLKMKYAVKRTYIDEIRNEEYSILTTPNALKKQFVGILALGYPEKVGVWSYTLLKEGRIDASSMAAYFQAFLEHDWGLIAINPHFFGPDSSGAVYLSQLETVVKDLAQDTKIGLIGFSMGGLGVIGYLTENKNILSQIVGIILLDPLIMSSLGNNEINTFLQKNSLLFSAGAGSLGEQASRLLRIPEIAIEGIHGEIPSKALKQIISFFKERLGSRDSRLER